MRLCFTMIAVTDRLDQFGLADHAHERRGDATPEAISAAVQTQIIFRHLIRQSIHDAGCGRPSWTTGAAGSRFRVASGRKELNY